MKLFTTGSADFLWQNPKVLRTELKKSLQVFLDVVQKKLRFKEIS